MRFNLFLTDGTRTNRQPDLRPGSRSFDGPRASGDPPGLPAADWSSFAIRFSASLLPWQDWTVQPLTCIRRDMKTRLACRAYCPVDREILTRLDRVGCDGAVTTAAKSVARGAPINGFRARYACRVVCGVLFHDIPVSILGSSCMRLQFQRAIAPAWIGVRHEGQR